LLFFDIPHRRRGISKNDWHNFPLTDILLFRLYLFIFNIIPNFYGFDSYINSKNLSQNKPVQKPDNKSNWGCTCFAAMGKKNGMTFGRNFDWRDCLPLILYCHPPKGYASFSVVDLEYLGYSRSNLPDKAQNNKSLLNSPFLPFDGINEKGVAIGMMALTKATGPNDLFLITC
jgi:hypothetical protein